MVNSCFLLSDNDLRKSAPSRFAEHCLLPHAAEHWGAAYLLAAITAYHPFYLLNKRSLVM